MPEVTESLPTQDGIISSDYLTPREYSSDIDRYLELDVYKMFRGYTFYVGYRYFTTISGYCSDCNISISNDSTARLSASLTMILADEVKDDFLVSPESFVWYNSAFCIKKIYKIFNDETGEYDTHTVNFGFGVPNNNSFTYNAETRELSISCVDLMTTISETRYGSLADWAFENKYWNNEVYVFKAGSIFDGYLSVNQMLIDVYYKFMTGINNKPPVINLYQDYFGLPYDFEFDTSVSLYDIYSKFVELYPNQTMYYDNQAILHFEQLPDYFSQSYSKYVFPTKDTMNMVVEENQSYNYENIYNYVVVFGRDNACKGWYMIRTSWTCPVCNVEYDTYKPEPSRYEPYHCPVCNSLLIGGGDEYELSADRIGVHKKVITSDTYITDSECENAAKVECFKNNRMSETLTVTLVDNYYDFYKSCNLGVGQKFEYTSLTTGETNLYILQKLSTDFKLGTITLELNKFYSLNPDVDTKLSPPLLTYTLSPTGLIKLTMSATEDNNPNHANGTPHSLYKIYKEVEFVDLTGNSYFPAQNMKNVFIGETCTTNDNNQTKTFTYQIDRDGIYRFKAKAYSPKRAASLFSNTVEVEVNLFRSRLLFGSNNVLKLAEDSYLLIS